MPEKFGIYVVNSNTGEHNLFAVAKEEKYVIPLRQLARKFVVRSENNADWVSVHPWRVMF